MSVSVYTPEQVLPHTAPMLLIDRIVDWGESWIETTAGAQRAGLFVDQNLATSSIICLEYLCQSAAAHAGICQLEQGKPIQIGFIIGARKVEIDQSAFSKCKHFQARIDQVYKDDDGIGVYDCNLYNGNCSGTKVAFALIKAVMPDDPAQVIHDKRIS